MSVALASTEDRWTAALERARRDGVRLQRTGLETAYRVASGAHTYFASATACSCPAGRAGDPVCKHRAAVRSAEALAAAPTLCRECRGHGWVSEDDTHVYRCLRCDGRGSVPPPRVVIVASSDDQPEPDPSGPASELPRLYAELDRYNAMLAEYGRLSAGDYRRFTTVQDRVAGLQTGLAAA